MLSPILVRRLTEIFGFIALVLVKLAVAIVAGFVQAVLTVVLLVALAFGVMWALRHI